MKPEKYFPKQIERKWVERWEKDKIYRADIPATEKPKAYTLSMFPYPSGAGLHVGHVRIYTGTDILARYFRMKGYSVLNPMGWDAFGLPAENAAIKAKKNPMDMVPENIANFKRQMDSLGFSFDWEREFATTDPEYYKWTQWLFLQLYSIKNKAGERLVYRKKAPINWCPFCKTGLANEEVLPDGTHERCGNKTVEKLMPQWLMRITDYADRLLADLEGLDWPNGILEMQKNWIGKKEGVIIPHKVEGLDFSLETFSAYPAWSFADTFIVVAPEHPFVAEILNTSNVIPASLSVIPAKAGIYIDSPFQRNDIEMYLERVKNETHEDRMAPDKEKTGIFTGYYAEDPFRKNEKMPIWIANFVLMDFGTGAIRCSAHDQRDVDFAKKYNLKLRQVVFNNDGGFVNAHANKGILQDSGPFTGKEVGEIQEEFIKWMEKEKIGRRYETYHLRDWIFSRQRYWGEPFPLIYCDKCGDENGVVLVPEEQLPVTLPHIDSYEPTETGESPLSQVKEWVIVKCPKCGGLARRETDTMPNWAGSCWYFLYFARNLGSKVRNFSRSELVATALQTSTSRRNSKHSSPNMSVNIKKWQSMAYPATPGVDNWLPVDWYLGGAEHAVLHLLYARFWVKAFNDLGLINFTEPFLRLRNVGMVLAGDHKKMSKSLGNVVTPDEVIDQYGADTLRVYEAFMAPFNSEVAWSTRAMQGAYRFISRIWQIYHNSDKLTKDQNDEDKTLLARLQTTIHKVTNDITNVKFNTAIASMMEFLNEWEMNAGPSLTPGVEEHRDLPAGRQETPGVDKKQLSRHSAKKFLQLLAPFAPFITDEIWQEVFGEKESIHLSLWPVVDKTVIKTTSVKIPIQVNGKVRAVLSVDALISQEELIAKATAAEKVKKWLDGKKYKAIYVTGKILNLVIK